jgi:flagellar hook-associated protein 1 FlgK
MSFFSFNTVGNALDAYQQALSVTSDNIANVGTPGASRQVADVTQAIPVSGSPFYSAHLGQPGTRGEGAVVNQITRIHQDSYAALFRGASSSQYYYTTEQKQLTTLQSNFGEPSAGVNTAYAALQTAVSNAAASPTSVAVRQSVLTQAQTFATALNSASSAISTQETSAIAQGTSIVAQANTLIDKIAALNGQIRALSATGDNPNTYLDERDTAIDALSQIVPTQTALQPNGSSLVTVAGRPLVNDTVAYHLSAPVVAASSNGTPTLVVGLANDADPLNPSAIPLASGQLGAFTDLYNNKLVPYAQQLDDFASSTADEMNRITQAGVDLNGNAGAALFTEPPGQTPVTAATISVAITDPTQLPLGLISTAAGDLTQPMNSANNTVSTSVALDGNETLLNPPPATTGLQGTLTIGVDGTTQTFAYDTHATAASTSAGVTTFPADTIGAFMTNFNAGHFGVTASYDTTTQTIGFTRDPNNTDAVHRGKQGSAAATADFTITDSTANAPQPPLGTTPPSAALTQGTPATGLLQALGATNINGVPQTAANALGTGDNGAANALTKLFSQNVGVGALQTTAYAISSNGPGSVTITQPPGTPGAFATVNVGQVLTIVDAATGTAQNVPVTAVDRITGSITVTATATITAADPITTAQTQTLGAAYQGLITQMGLDTSTSTTGVATQTALASSIDAARQSVDGINIDEETQNLLKFQSAYTAAAKTLSTLNDVMQTTLNLITGG